MSDTNHIKNTNDWIEIRPKPSKGSGEIISNQWTNIQKDHSTIINTPFINKKNYSSQKNNYYDRNNQRNYNSSKSTRSLNSNDQGNKSVKIELIIWGDLEYDAETMLRIYDEKKHIYEKSAFLDKNVITILERLAKNWRYDVIKLFREKNNNFSKKKIHTIQAGTATPFHRLVWPHERICANINDQTILAAFETFKELLRCGFRLFDSNETIAEKETFLKCLQYGDDAGHPISLEYRMKMYDMFTNITDPLSLCAY